MIFVYVHDLGPNRMSREFKTLAEARSSAQARANRTGKKVEIDRLTLDSKGFLKGQSTVSSAKPNKKASKKSNMTTRSKREESFDPIFGGRDWF